MALEPAIGKSYYKIRIIGCIWIKISGLFGTIMRCN